MTDWLEEIEADARLHTHVGNTTATGGGSVVIVGKADYDRLIARVRELEAQLDIVTDMLDVALDAYPDLNNAPAMQAAFSGQPDAALAALDGEREEGE